ncbi:MAG: ATP-dependent DNA helicase PIF1 [Flavobacteriaceae bacterium]|jgi:ATP-dependent DNA helicase PIF1
MIQADALTILKTGANVFLTGEPGSGKTHVLNSYIAHLKEHSVSVAVTASTGIAATHVGGVTIHSWSGMGIKKTLTEEELDALESKQYLWKRFDKAKVLVIDEISMLDGDTFNTLNKVCKQFKRNEKPFGGMQIILVGDFFQLPPVSRGEETMTFAFESDAWKELKPLSCYLSEQHRQDDEVLLSLLSKIRKGDIEDGFEILEDRLNKEFDDVVSVTKLYTHNADVDELNSRELENLPDASEEFYMEHKGKDNHVQKLIGSCLSPQVLSLKKGALVMCTKNNFEIGFANGTLGEVIDFDDDTGYPVIATNNGKELIISPMSWAVHDGETTIASLEQIPLRLAWAITIHKSQGMSLDAAVIDLSRAFEYGQGYVALSRVRSLDGLSLAGFNPQALVVHPRVLSYDEVLKSQSSQISDYLNGKTEEEIENKQKDFIVSQGGSLEKKDITLEEKKESTFTQTLLLLKESKSLEDIAFERDLTVGTILSHVEKLLDDGDVTFDEIVYIKPTDKKFDAIVGVFQEIYDESGELHLSPVKAKCTKTTSYFDVQLARLFIDKKK